MEITFGSLVEWAKRTGVKSIAILFITAGVSLIGWGWVGVSCAAPVWADTAVAAVAEHGAEGDGAEGNGAVLFAANCAGCHPKGGNIIKRGKTLKLKPLKKRHLDSVDAIATLVTHGKGLMSAYGETLTPEEIQTVSTYVWDHAQRNWKP